ncbi:unnamed protein product [Ectocarpus sp. 4 AP-2014]
MESVLQRLTLVGGQSKRNRSPIYVMYAMALHPSSAFVAGNTKHLQRARNGEIIDYCDPDLFAFFELLEAITEDEARFCSANDNKRLDDVVLMAEKWIPPLISFKGKGFDRKHISRKVFLKGLRRIEQRLPALKNRSFVVNGANSKTGAPRPPFVSTSGTVVPISQQVLQGYVLDSDVKGHHGRVMYLCFAVLVVDRALFQEHEEGLDVPQRFKDLWKAMLRSAKLLKDLLLSSAECLTAFVSKGEEESLFDASRVRIFYPQKQAEAESGVGEDGKEHSKFAGNSASESRRVVATCERGKVHLSLTDNVRVEGSWHGHG